MQLTGIREMEMAEIPTPEIKDPKDVLVKMKTVGVCGSDVHYFLTGKIGCQVVEYPYPVGHECAGIVEKTGNAVTKVKPGDRIAIDPAMPCWECDQCKAGRPHTCRTLKFLGSPMQADGCLSEYIVIPEDSCFPIKDSMTFDQAALTEPLSVGAYAIKLSIPMKGKQIGILGCGPIGTSVLLAALSLGAKEVYVTDKLDYRLEMAKNSGAFWTGNPDKTDIVKEISGKEPLLLDAVFECCGQQDAVFQAVDILKPGGKLVIIGIPPELDNWQFPVDKLRHQEICIQNVRRQNHCVNKAIDMIDNKEINVDGMVTHRFALEDTKEAFELVAEYKDGVMKAMIDI